MLSDIDSALKGHGQTTAPQKTDNIAANKSASSADARKLVSQARGALKNGNTEQAEQLAVEKHKRQHNLTNNGIKLI